jgi:ceramide glucosyltransferase
MILSALQAILLALIGIYALSVALAHLLAWRYFARYERAYPAAGYHPAVSIIKPTKGVDQRAFENFRSFCEQDYSGPYEILFCVEERTDPAVPVIERVIAAYPDQQVRLIFSDPHDTRSVGKLKNMIAGLAESAYDVVIFSDSDAHAPPTFLAETVACVERPAVGLGFCAPAYVGAENWAAALTSVAVNELVLRLAPVCLLGLFDGAVGTTFVVRKAVLRQAGGLERFGRQISDEIPLARAIHKLGYQIHLLRRPAWVAHPRDSFARWWTHMHRWRVIIRHYWPAKYLLLSLLELAPWWSIAYLAVSAVRGERLAPAALLVAAVLALSSLSAAVVHAGFARNRRLWRFAWVVPLYELLRLPLLVHGYLTNEIVWRERRFRINRDGTTKIVENLAAARDGP